MLSLRSVHVSLKSYSGSPCAAQAARPASLNWSRLSVTDRTELKRTCLDAADQHVAGAEARTTGRSSPHRLFAAPRQAVREVLEELEATMRLMRRNRDVIARLSDLGNRRNGASARK